MKLANAALHRGSSGYDKLTNIITYQGRPKAPPETQNASQKSLGTKIRKLGGSLFFVLREN